MMHLPASTGYAFPGLENLQHDIYPSITASTTSALHQPGKTVLITGAGRGIGRATALQYAHAGVACLILCARTASELDEVESRITEINCHVKVRKYTLDVTSELDVQRVASSIKDQGGKLDILINNAGATEPWVPMSSADPSTWWKTFEVNIKGPFLCLHAFLPLLLDTANANKLNGDEEGVDVVNVSSIGAHGITPGASAYQTSKLALCRLTEFIMAEYADQGVRAYSLHPGGVPTVLAKDIKQIRDYLNDTPDLAGGFMVWLTAKKREWLAGRYVSATWDVNVLENMREEIVQGDKLKVKMVV